MRRSVAGQRNRSENKDNHHAGSKPYVKWREEAEEDGAQVPCVKVYEDTHPGQHENIEKVKASAQAYILKLAKEKYPDLSEEELPLNEIKVTNVEGQAIIMNNAFPSKLGYYVKGLGATGEGLLSKMKCTPRHLTSVAEALEIARKASEEAKSANERHTATIEAGKEREAKITDKINALEEKISLLTVALLGGPATLTATQNVALTAEQEGEVADPDVVVP